MRIKVRLSKQCLTRFIWPNREATVVVTWSLKVKLVSRITPRSLAAFTGVSCFPISESLTLSILAAINQLWLTGGGIALGL